MARTYEGKLRLASVLAVVGATAAGVIGGRIARLGEPGEHFWLVFPLLLGAGALALAAMVPWWRRVDDVQKSVHLASWFWGGMAGGIAVLMALVASVGVRGDLAEGAGLALVGQAVGFLVVLGVARLRQQGAGA